MMKILKRLAPCRHRYDVLEESGHWRDATDLFGFLGYENLMVVKQCQKCGRLKVVKTGVSR